MRFRVFVACLLLLPFAGCASLPPADYDSLRSGDTGDADQHLDYLRRQSEQVAGTQFVDGNHVTLLQNGAAAYPAMLKAIHGARRRIDMESFTFDGIEGGEFAKALLQSRARGVEVNLIYDSFGSMSAPQELFARMRRGGIKVVEYNPINTLSVIDTEANHRDHRKLLLIDGKTVFIGGINISAVYRLEVKIKDALRVGPEEEEEKDADAAKSGDVNPLKRPWRDTQVKIDGPVVAKFEQLYMDTWRSQKGPAISDPQTSSVKRGDLPVEAIDETPTQNSYKIYQSLLAAIALSRNSIHMMTGFFVPVPELVDALENAARRGVDVTIIMPSQSTSNLAIHASHAYYGELMDAGVKIYERQGVILHAKTAVIDGVWSTVGSANLDWRSAVLNNECNAVILGPAFGQQMEAMFRQDVAESKFIDPESWGDRRFLDRLNGLKATLVEYFL